MRGKFAREDDCPSVNELRLMSTGCLRRGEGRDCDDLPLEGWGQKSEV